MSRSAKFLVASFAVGVLALIVGELWVDSIVAEPARGFVERSISEATGLEARIRGTFDLDLVPVPRVEATQLTLTADGKTDPALTIEEVELDLNPWPLLAGVVAFDELQLAGARLSLPLAGGAPAPDLEALVAPSDGGKDFAIDFRIERIELRDLSVEYIDATGFAMPPLVIDTLSLSTDAPDAAISVSVAGSFDASPFDIQGEIGALAELLRPTIPYPISLHGRLPVSGIEADVVGQLAEPTRLVGIDAAVSIVVPELASLLPAADAERPPIGSIRITGHVRDPDGVLAVEDLRVEPFGDSHVGIAATGSIRDLRELRGVELDARIDADGLEFLHPFVDVPIPALDSIEFEAHVSDGDGSLGAQGRVRATGAGGGLSIELSGSDGDLRNFEELDVAFDARVRDLALVGEMAALDFPLPTLGPVTARGRLRGRVGALGIEELTVRVGERDATWLEVGGSLKDLANFSDVHLVANFYAAHLRHLQSFIERVPPDVGPLRGGATLSDSDGSLGIDLLRVTGGQPGGEFTVDFSGSLDDLRNVDEIAFDAAIKAASLETIGALFGAEWPAVGPVSFESHVKGSDESLSLRGKVRLGESEFVGTASAAFVAGTRPSLLARIESPHIHLDQIALTPGTRPGDDSKAAGDGKSRSWWSGSEPLPFERLRAIDADIELRAKRVSAGDDFEMRDLGLALLLDDGHLVIRDAAAGFEGGSLRAELSADARTPDPSLALRLDAYNVDLGGFLSQLRKGKQSTGILDVSIALESDGHSPAALRSNLRGDLSAVLRDGSVVSDYGNEFAKNVIRLSLPALLSKREAGFGCAVLEFEVEEGIAVARTLVVDAENVIVVGSGEIDLGAGTFDLILLPKAHKPGVVNLSASVEVTGPLEQPVFRARHRTIPRHLTKGILANVFAPMSAALRPLRKKAERLCREGLTPPTRPAD